MNMYNITMEIQYQHQIPLAAVSLAFFMVVLATFGAVWIFVFSGLDEEDGGGGNNQNATAAEAPLGSAANPVVVDDDDEHEHETTNNQNNNNTNNVNDNNNNAEFWERNDGITPLLNWANNSARHILQNLSPMHVILAAGFILPLSMIIPIFMDGGASALFNGSNNNTLQLSMFAFLAHSLMALGAYRLLRQVLNNPDGVGVYPGMRRQGGGGGRRRSRRYTVGDIEGMVRKVPVEEFVSEEDLKVGACSISKMKRMLVNRGASDSLHRCLDRSDLLEEIEKVRKYNEECAICAEQYQEGDALRVLKCQHEFHLHCFDRWVYTFATDSRRGYNKPSCPLCKTKLCE